jgi:hypothetical protein
MAEIDPFPTNLMAVELAINIAPPPTYPMVVPVVLPIPPGPSPGTESVRNFMFYIRKRIVDEICCSHKIFIFYDLVRRVSLMAYDQFPQNF